MRKHGDQRQKNEEVELDRNGEVDWCWSWRFSPLDHSHNGACTFSSFCRPTEWKVKVKWKRRDRTSYKSVAAMATRRCAGHLGRATYSNFLQRIREQTLIFSALWDRTSSTVQCIIFKVEENTITEWCREHVSTSCFMGRKKKKDNSWHWDSLLFMWKIKVNVEA